MTPVISDAPIWADIASAIRASGSVPGIQLATAWEGYVGSKVFVTTDPQALIAQGRNLIQGLGSKGVADVLCSFDVAAEMATGHGFGHIQIHAAHGYLLSLLVDARINPKAADTHVKLAALSERLQHQGVETSLRISMKSGYVEFDNEGTVEFQNAVAKLPFDFIDLSSGFYNIDKRLIYPARPDVLDERLHESVAIGARNPSQSFIISGKAFLNSWRGMPANLHPGLCRDLIANPNFLREAGNGCKNRGKCHYYSRGEKHITCGMWQ